MPLIGYGEDALTLWACTQQLPAILTKLGDNTVPGDCLFFYRPSFGRKGGQYGSEFGEFDGILATRQFVYPIESKWMRSATRDGLVRLKRRQVLRHEIFQWLRQRWRPAMSWADFAAAYRDEFSQAFGLKPLAPVGSDLADNTERVLNLLVDYPSAIQHVLLAFCRKDCHAPRAVAPCELEFRLVTMSYASINPGGMFYMLP